MPYNHLKNGKSPSEDIIKIVPFIKHNKSIDGKATAYVCSNYVCKLPTNNPNQMLALLNLKDDQA